MRKMNKWFSIAAVSCALLLADGQSGVAAPVREEKVRKAVETWVRHVTAHKRLDGSIERLEPFRTNGVIGAYIVHLAGGGYCLAGADSLTLPVYWYCPKGDYDPNNPGCRAILSEICQRANFLSGEMAKGGASLAAHKERLNRRAVMWDDLSVGKAASSLTAPSAGTGGGAAPLDLPTPVAPSLLELPLTSLWNQDAPYNLSCPAAPSGPSDHTYVGCVATAMAQIMYYWHWPISGEGTASISYELRSSANKVYWPFPVNPGIPAGWNGGILGWEDGQLWMTGYWDQSVLAAAKNLSDNFSYQIALELLYGALNPSDTVQTADFGHTTYQWNLLKDYFTDLAEDGADEVAKLSSHAGIAVKMDYGIYGSTAFSADIPGALSSHFRFDSDASESSRETDQMVEEINWLRPCFLTGQDTNNEGHCWAVCGYNKLPGSLQFKMNLGWGGDANGWYSVDDAPRGFTNSQRQVTMVAPRDVVRFVGSTSSGDGSPSSPYRNIEEAITRAADNTTLIFKAYSANTFSAPVLVLNRPLTLKGIQATISK